MVKEKPNSVRTYDAEGFRRRASCLCFRDKTEQEVCIIHISCEYEIQYSLPYSKVI
jgi:diphosphoinositol-polyphosphate diphosphatase